MLLSTVAIADAVGIGYEYRSKEYIEERKNNLLVYGPHQLGELGVGMYSDDTQQSIALAEYLLEDHKHPYDQHKLASKFLEVFNRDKRKGYSKSFQALLESVKDTDEFLDRIFLFGKSESNGAAMRAGVIGLHQDLEFVKAFSKFQAKLTHQGTAVLAAQAAALSVYYFKNCVGFPSDLPEFLNRELEVNEDWTWDGRRVASKENLGLKTVKAAIHAVLTTRTFTECLYKCIYWGGDTDSVAAIAAAISSVNQFHENDVSTSLIVGLEPNNENYGLDFLVSMDAKLNRKFKVYVSNR